MKAIITGSFDPITTGHIEIVKKASRFFNELYVVALLNAEKKYMFTMEEKKEIIALSLDGIANVKVDAYDGLTADYMHKNGISKIVRGIRGESDEAYETDLAEKMKAFDKDFETIFIKSDEKYANISSTMVRERIEKGESIDGLVHENAKSRMIEIYNSKNN